MIAVRRVDGTKPEIAALLHWMQLATMPHDVPLPGAEGWWWVAWDSALPVAFAGLRRCPDPPEYGYLCRAGVLPAARGRHLQRRLIRAREAFARRHGMTVLVTDTTDNPRSANSLIGAGFRMYRPAGPWALPSSCYWRKELR